MANRYDLWEHDTKILRMFDHGIFDHGIEIRNQANKNLGQHVPKKKKKNIYAKRFILLL